MMNSNDTNPMSATTQAELSKQEFIRQFSLLSSNADGTVKEAANQYILKFQKTDAVWQAARDMIINPPSVQLQCLGAQMLCKKLKTDYAKLSIQQRLELRTFFFEVISLYCTQGTSYLSKIAKSQLILSIAILGFTGIHLDWQDFIQDICTFMKQDRSEEFIVCGLEILENVGSAESMEKVVPDLKVFLRIRSLFQGHMSALSAIFNELLVHSNRSIGLKTLECIESWTGSQFKYQVFLDEQLTRNLLLLMGSSDEELFSKVAKIMLEGIQNSNNAEILQTANVAASLSLMQAGEISGLKALISALVSRAGAFVATSSSQASSKSTKVSRLFAEIVTELASKFGILILENTEHSSQLLSLVLICTQHSNLYISQSSFDFWISFYRILKTYVPDIKENSSDWLINPYIQVFQAVLQKCKLRNLGRNKKGNTGMSTNGEEKKEKRSKIQKKSSIQLQKKYSLFPTETSGGGNVTDGGFDMGYSSSKGNGVTDHTSVFDSNGFFGGIDDLVEVDEIDGEAYFGQFSDGGEAQAFGVDGGGGEYDDDDDDDSYYYYDELGSKKNKPSLDFDEFNSETPQIGLKEFRVLAKDIFNTVYNVISQFRGPSGVYQLMSMLYSLLDKQKFIATLTGGGTAAATESPDQIDNAYCAEVEVCLFIVQTISSNMSPSNYGSSISGNLNGVNTEGDNFFSFFFEYIVKSEDFPAHEKTVSMAMQLFYNAQSELTKSIALFDAIIRFILKFLLDDALGLIAAQTFSGIIKELGPNDAIETFKFAATFFVSHIDHISRECVLDELIQGVFGFALNLKSQQHQIEAIQSLLQIIQQIINQTHSLIEHARATGSPSQDGILVRAVGIIQSLLSGFSAESISLPVKMSVAEFIQANFTFLTCSFDTLTQKPNAKQTISQFIAIFRYVSKIFIACSTNTGTNNHPNMQAQAIPSINSQVLTNDLQSQQSNGLIKQNPSEDQNGIHAGTYLFFSQYIAFLNISILIQQRNPVLFCETMMVFKTILNITKTSEQYHAPFLAWLQQNFNEYNRFYLDFMSSTATDVCGSGKPLSKGQQQSRKDPDLIMHFYEIQVQVIKYFSEFYLQHGMFMRVIEFSFETVLSISQYEMTRSILNYFYEFIKYCAHGNEATQDVILRIIDIVVDILPNVNSNLLHNIALIFVKLVEVYRERTPQLHAFILARFQSKEKYAQFTPVQQKILVDCIIQFSVNCKNVNPLKNLLIDLYQVLKDLLPSTEMFMNYEIKLKAILDGTNDQRPTHQPQTLKLSNQAAFLEQLSASLLARNKPANKTSDLDDLFK